MARWKPKLRLEVGDLVRISEEAIKLEIVETKPNIGIIVSKPYCYISTECDGVKPDSALVELEHWCYDIAFGNKVTKMMPEDFIEPIPTTDDGGDDE